MEHAHIQFHNRPAGIWERETERAWQDACGHGQTVDTRRIYVVGGGGGGERACGSTRGDFYSLGITIYTILLLQDTLFETCKRLSFLCLGARQQQQQQPPQEQSGYGASAGSGEGEFTQHYWISCALESSGSTLRDYIGGPIAGKTGRGTNSASRTEQRGGAVATVSAATLGPRQRGERRLEQTRREEKMNFSRIPMGSDAQ